MATRKWTTVAVRVSRQRLARWGGAAQHEGAPNVAAWLSRLATERLRHLGSFAPRLVLRWRRSHFKALRLPHFHAKEATLHDVSGLVAGPFGIYKNQEGEDLRPRLPPVFHLVHVPTGSHLAKLPLRRSCKNLARELAPFKVNWDAAVEEEVPGPDWPLVLDAINRAKRAAYGSPVTGRREEEASHG